MFTEASSLRMFHKMLQYMSSKVISDAVMGIKKEDPDKMSSSLSGDANFTCMKEVNYTIFAQCCIKGPRQNFKF